MDQRSVSEFLRTRRDRLTPEQVGIIGGGRRRVAGLRREEVAFLAGVSVDYYARMERGDLSGVSAEVLDSLATALRLDDAESEHLHDLAAATAPRSGRRRRTQPVQTVPPRLQRFLDSITGSPVWVRDRRMDYVTANALGRALYAPILEDPVYRGNTARFMFLSITAPTLFPDWDEGADTIVATLRDYAGKHPRDKGLTNLIGELVTRSDAFRDRWAAHNVRHHHTGLKRIHHPAVGDLELCYEALELPAYPDWFVFAFTAEPGTPSEERLKLLGSLAATSEPRATVDQPEL